MRSCRIWMNQQHYTKTTTWHLRLWNKLLGNYYITVALIRRPSLNYTSDVVSMLLEYLHVYCTTVKIITSAEEGYAFTSVCSPVCPSDNWKSCERILTKFLVGVRHGSNKYLVDSDQSRIANLHCKNHSAISLCWSLAEVWALWVLLVLICHISQI